MKLQLKNITLVQASCRFFTSCRDQHVSRNTIFRQIDSWMIQFESPSRAESRKTIPFNFSLSLQTTASYHLFSTRSANDQRLSNTSITHILSSISTVSTASLQVTLTRSRKFQVCSKNIEILASFRRHSTSVPSYTDLRTWGNEVYAFSSSSKCQLWVYSIIPVSITRESSRVCTYILHSSC